MPPCSRNSWPAAELPAAARWFRKLGVGRRMKFKPLLPWIAAGALAAGLPVCQASASEVDAAGYYEMRCATCHGANGEGTRDKSPSLGPPLRGNSLVMNA